MTCTSEAELKAAKFHIGSNLGFFLFELFTSRKILTLRSLLAVLDSTTTNYFSLQQVENDYTWFNPAQKDVS